MDRRYLLSSQSAILSSTIHVDFKSTSENSMVVNTRMVNISSQVARNSRKLFTVFDPEMKIISFYTSPDDTFEEPMKIRLSTFSLGPTISRRFPDVGLITLATCSSAESAFLSGETPPGNSRSYFFFEPKHPPAKITKNIVLWVESFSPTQQDFIHGLRTTKCFVKKMTKMVSGTVIKIYRVRKSEEDEDIPIPIVDYVTSVGNVFKVRQTFADILNAMPQPLPEVIGGLIEY